MGKTKGRRTRWRTLNIKGGEDGEQYNSDSEEGSITPPLIHHPHQNHRAIMNKSQQHNGQMNHHHHHSNNNHHYGNYSSQSTPSRRYDVTKSTRSSSTASDTKITFNEDEYTRITTPRQDVLFKKGYLNKPRTTYQTQTSTGNSTTSTGNSTGNGTPDHQSTDLEYESQFVFPNGFVDQNGIYFINGFEPYPLMVFNPPTYYQEFSDVKKRDSTGSLTESMISPNNEEANSESNCNVSDGIQEHFQQQDEEDIEQTCQEQETDVDTHQSLPEHCRHSSTPTSPEEGAQITPSMSSSTSDMSTAEERTLNHTNETKYNLKPDAEEFVPRAFRPQAVQFTAPPPNFLPILNPPPTAIPINFIPTNYVNFIPNMVPEHQPELEQYEEVVVKSDVPKNQIDIAKIVSKLEEAAKEQQEQIGKNDCGTKQKSYSNNENNKRRNFRNNTRGTRFQKEEPPQHKSWHSYNRTRNVETRTPQPPTTPQPIKNYSDTLKRISAASPRAAQRNPNNHQPNSVKTTPVKEKKSDVVKPLATTPNQWISVSNRKSKRKNKNVEEVDGFEDEEVDKDLFESYDVDLLEDVVVEVAENVKIPAKTEDVLEEQQPSVVEAAVTVEVVPEPTKEEPIVEIEEETQTKTPKKRWKKKTLKNTASTKRVIIIDQLDAPLAIEDKSAKEVDVEGIKEEPANRLNTVEVEPAQEEVVEDEKPQPIDPEVVEETAVEEKKPQPSSSKKNKKKRASKPAQTTINRADSLQQLLFDDSTTSYDFLLIESETSTDKTNIEVSQELDKMIQRGMYNNLEEKLKSLNIDSNRDDDDDFFKTIITNISRESSVEKSNNPQQQNSLDLSKVTSIVSNKPKPVLLEPVIRASPSQPPQNHTYPIMTAVKDWMSKTKETSPDVELLKSPDEILKEFGEEKEEEEEMSSDDENVAVHVNNTEKKNSERLPKHGNLPYRAICCSIM